MASIGDTKEIQYGGHWRYRGNSIWRALEILRKFNMEGIRDIMEI